MLMWFETRMYGPVAGRCSRPSTRIGTSAVATARTGGNPMFQTQRRSRGVSGRAIQLIRPLRRPRDHLEHVLERLSHREAVGLHDDRVLGGAERRDGAFAVDLVAPQDLVKELLPRAHLAPRRELIAAALRAFGRRRGEEDLA